MSDATKCSTSGSLRGRLLLSLALFVTLAVAGLALVPPTLAFAEENEGAPLVAPVDETTLGDNSVSSEDAPVVAPAPEPEPVVAPTPEPDPVVTPAPEPEPTVAPA
ncbi:MAG: hypothetical protein E7Z98_06335, partial [Olsenella sp.]|nr:hypothetical protein [Olsenella sp.]